MKTLIRLGTTVLDTDSIIKISIKPEKKCDYLLEKFLKLDGSYYIHAHIIKEVKWPQECTDLLNRLIEIKKINVLEDCDLINMLKENYIMPYRTFLSNLKICCEIFNTEYYERYYSILEDIDFKKLDKKDFIKKD